MSLEVLFDGSIFINGVDLSDHASEATLTPSVTLKEATVFGDVAVRKLAGLKDATLAITFRNDFASAKVDATLWACYGVQVPLRFRKSKTAAIGTENPEYQFNGMWSEYPISAQVGEVAGTQVTFELSDGVALVRDVTP